MSMVISRPLQHSDAFGGQSLSCPDLALESSRFFDSSRNFAVYGTRGWNRSCAETLSHHWVTWLSSVVSQVFKLKLEFKSDIWSAMRSGIVANVSDACTFYFSCLVIRWHSAHIVHLSSNTWHAQWAQAGVILYNLLTGRTVALFADSQMNLLNPSRCARCQVTIPSWPLGPCRKGRQWNGRRPKDMDSTVDDLRFAPSTKPDFSFKREVLTRWQSELTRSIQEDWHTHLISFDHL